MHSDAKHPPVVSRERWLAARKALLVEERALTHRRDDVARARRALPWVRVETDYVFATVDGPRALSALFDGRRQLLVQHFMLAPGWDAGCPSCSFMADHVDGMRVHLAQRDVTFVAVSRAPLDEIERFRARMGWRFPWVSSCANTFNRDFHVTFAPDAVHDYNFGLMPDAGDEMPGISVFVRDDDGAVHHTYSTYGRGVEVMMGTYALLDLVPAGRGERDVPHKMEWVRHHDRYDDDGAHAACRHRAD